MGVLIDVRTANIVIVLYRIMRCPLFCIMLNEINNWVQNGCNYQQGVGIYERYGSDTFLKILFKRPEDHLKVQKLSKALLALRDEASPEVEPVVITPEPTTQNPQPTTPKQAPALLKLINQRDNNYAQLRGLHPYLSTMAEGEDLRKLAVQIIKMGHKNSEHWEKINYFQEHGELAEMEKPQLPAVMIDINLLNKRENIRKSLSKARQTSKTQQTEKGAIKTKQLVEVRTQELQEIDTLIAKIKGGANA